MDHDGRFWVLDIEDDNHAFLGCHEEPLELRVEIESARACIRCLYYPCGLVLAEVLDVNYSVLADGVKEASVLINDHPFHA